MERARAAGGVACAALFGLGFLAAGWGDRPGSGQSGGLEPQSPLAATPVSAHTGLSAVKAGRGYVLRGGGVVARLGRRSAVFGAGADRFALTVAGMGRGRIHPAPVTSIALHGNHVALAGPDVVEWYAAKPSGIEQGFTLRRPPS